VSLRTEFFQPPRDCPRRTRYSSTTVLDFWANQTPLFRGKLLRHPNSPDLSDSLIPFSGSGKMVFI
jgi:hypothetical protein